ncbi:MAG: hypothetical protein KDD53_04535 [Bdellovibrionales bacterium]|nr:hypothetical protein [Bdellovibrionales bacterium]
MKFLRRIFLFILFGLSLVAATESFSQTVSGIRILDPNGLTLGLSRGITQGSVLVQVSNPSSSLILKLLQQDGLSEELLAENRGSGKYYFPKVREGVWEIQPSEEPVNFIKITITRAKE